MSPPPGPQCQHSLASAPRLAPSATAEGCKAAPHAYLTSEQDCQFLMDNDPNNDLDLWRTQIYMTMQWPEHWMDEILKSGISVFEKKLSKQRQKAKSGLFYLETVQVIDS